MKPTGRVFSADVWDENKHPRVPAGSSEGGEFAHDPSMDEEIRARIELAKTHKGWEGMSYLDQSALSRKLVSEQRRQFAAEWAATAAERKARSTVGAHHVPPGEFPMRGSAPNLYQISLGNEIHASIHKSGSKWEYKVYESGSVYRGEGGFKTLADAEDGARWEMRDLVGRNRDENWWRLHP